MLGISGPRSIVTVFGVVYALLSFGASSADAAKPQPSTIIDDIIPCYSLQWHYFLQPVLLQERRVRLQHFQPKRAIDAGLDVRFGSNADSCSAQAMSALPPIATSNAT